MIDIQFVNEFEISQKTHKKINNLLAVNFKDCEYYGRSYYKQIPPYRLLAREEGKLVGHLAINYRAMNLNCEAIKVFGVDSLCVSLDAQKQGIGTMLMNEFEKIAVQYSNNIDFLFLVTDTPKYYERLGYQTTKIKTIWLKIHEHETYGEGNESIDDAFFMYKSVNGKEWKDGNLNLLGYMY